ncbi:MAG: hypothetical protein ACETVY_02945, partial [Candidatus Bathyarchaeia archaeon]
MSPVTVMGDPVITDVTDEDGTTITGGVYDDLVRVFGDGVTAGVDVNLYWDSVKVWAEGKGFLNSSEGKPDGSFEIWFKVPEAVNGLHYLWIKDASGTGTPDSEAFSVDAMIRLNPGSGLTGDGITIKGHGFGGNKNVNNIDFGTDNLITNPSVPVTDDLGYWEATFNVPPKADNDYTITAEDADNNIATATFTIGPAISLDVDEGPVGTLVEVDGRGFTAGRTVTSITLGGVDCGVTDENDLDINGNGEFTFELAVPSVSQSGKEYELFVSDSWGKDATIYFLVTGLASITLDPMFGPPGTSVSIEGINFAPGRAVSVSISGTGKKTFQTNSKGEFSGSYTIPAISSGTYDVTAEQADFYIEDSRPFRVGTMVVILSPTTGPSGKEVALTGTGFTAGGDWNASMDGKALFEDESVSGDTTLFGIFYVPTFEPGVYTVTVTDVDEKIKVTKEFTVTEKTSINMDPVTAPVGFNVTIEGFYFAESDDSIDVDFTIYNATDDWDMDVYQGTGAVATGDDGGFNAWWVVPQVLSEGTYTVNATDDEGLFAQSSFSVGSSVVSISSRKATYARGNTVGFDLESSFREEDSYITILDPDGSFAWQTDDLDTWIRVGVTYVAPLYTQTAGGNPMTLESDAPLGTWTYTWYDSEDDELASGSFVVAEETTEDEEEPEDGVITDAQYEELLAEIEDLREDVDQLLATVDQLSGTTSTSIGEVLAEVRGVKEDVDDALDSVEDAKGVATEARDEVDAVKADAEQALSTASGHTTMVYAALGASLVAIL